MAGLVNTQWVQQFKVKEDQHMGGLFKEYKYKLQQFEDPYTGREVQDNIDVKDLVHVQPHFWTVQGTMTITLRDFNGNTRKLSLHKPHMKGFNRYWSWRVTEKDDSEKVLFTIQRRLWNDHCKLMIWKCKAIWKIYVGHKGDKSTLVYYGVGDADDEDEPSFKFYHSEDSYKQNKKMWAAKIAHDKEDEEDAEDTFKVKVMPEEDTAILLIATVCIDAVADNVQAANDD